MVGILILQAEELVCAVPYIRFALQFTPTVINSKPNQIAMNVGHLPRYADLVVVEIAKVLCFVLVVMKDLSQRFVAVLVGVDIGVSAFVGILLK